MSVFDLSAVKNRPSRSGFDLSVHRPFTAKVGELLPVYTRMVYPGDKFNLKEQHMTRTQPLNTAAYVRMREYFDWYFVPLRLINKNLPQSIMQMQDQPVQAASVSANKILGSYIPYTVFNNPLSLGNSVSEACLRAMYYGSLTSTDYSDSIKTNAYGFSTSALAIKLLRYLQYGNIGGESLSTESDSSIISTVYGYTTGQPATFSKNKFMPQYFGVAYNILPMLAYHKIYSDYFRFSQWEKAEPFTYNCDWYTSGDFFAALSSSSLRNSYLLGNNIFTLRYCNWTKDMFTGILPDKQLGDIASVSGSINGTDASNPAAKHSVLPLQNFSTDSGTIITPATMTLQSFSTSVLTRAALASRDGTSTFPATVNADSLLGVKTSNVAFTVLSLRMAEALQKWKEVAQCADQDYKSQLEAHFNVKLSNALSDRCTYIGGSASNININEVENNNLTEGEATLKGKGISTGQSFESFTANEYGIVMCIYHAVPLIDWFQTACSPEWIHTEVTDLPVPEFDRIGLEALPFGLFQNTQSLNTTHIPLYPSAFETPMGYLPRYYELKMGYDSHVGAFETTLRDWIVTIDYEKLQNQALNSFGNAINYHFFKVNPSMMDTVFGVAADSTVDTDQLLVNCFFDVSAVRNFDYDGMPY